MSNPNPVNPGDAILASWANAVVDALVRLGRIRGTYPISVRKEPTGISIGLATQTKFWLFEATGDTYDYGETIGAATVHVVYANRSILANDGTYTTDAASADTFELFDPQRIGAFAPVSDSSDKGLAGDKYFASFNAQTGRWEIVGGPQVRWAKCTAHWNKSDGYPYTVTANPCANAAGADPDTATEITIKIYAGDTASGDGRAPNVETDNVIAYCVENGDLVCASDVLDGRIADVRETLDDDAVIQGWADMDGIANATDLGGSGIDRRRKFARAGSPGVDASGSTGGSDTVTVADHPDHGHNLIADSLTNGYANPGPGAVNFPLGLKPFTSGVYLVPGGVDDTGAAAGTRATSLPHDPADCVPAFVYVRCLERLDNSTDFYP